MVLERWIGAVLRFRLAVLLAWLALLIVGVWSSFRLPPLLANSFAVPGTDSQRAREILERQFGERPDGTFVVVFPTRHPSDRSLQAALRRRLSAAAATVPTGRAGRLRDDGTGILYGEIETRLDLQHAKGHTG